MGSYLSTLDFGSVRTAKTIGVGGSHVCVILDNDQLTCFGKNFNGQLGRKNRNQTEEYEPRNHIGDDPYEMGDNLTIVNLGTDRTAKAIALGDEHTCVLLDNNQVKCFGRNL